MSKTIKEIKERLNEKGFDLNTMIRVRAKAEIKLVEQKDEQSQGVVEAYVSIFDNIDLVGDIIRRGAFSESLNNKLPKGVWMHNWDEPIAKTLKAYEDNKGLFIQGQFNLETQRGKEAYSDIKFGIIDEFSIGFKILDYEWDEKDNRIIKKVKLYEWSPVLAGANPDTELVSVKGNSKTEPMVDFVEVDNKSKEVKLFYKGGEKQNIKMSNKYIAYLKSLDEEGQKVDTLADTQKVLRIRQVVKQIDKQAEYLLRITK
ncbi:MAG: HK97 family phage prohead protease [Candidatus Falkowbacteria bacterium]|nr:HK97 family phage prohead protease [Candidatus Falkowbacteria bacterium]